MTLVEIKQSIDEAKTVKWHNDGFASKMGDEVEILEELLWNSPARAAEKQQPKGNGGTYQATSALAATSAQNVMIRSLMTPMVNQINPNNINP